MIRNNNSVKLDGNIKNEIQKNNDPDPLKITIEVDACVESITGGVCTRTHLQTLSNQYLLSGSNMRNGDRVKPHGDATLIVPAPDFPKKGKIKK